MAHPIPEFCDQCIQNGQEGLGKPIIAILVLLPVDPGARRVGWLRLPGLESYITTLATRRP